MDPQVVLGVDSVQKDTAHASTVESFFLQHTSSEKIFDSPWSSTSSVDQIVTSTSGHDAPHFGSNNNNEGKSRKKTKGKTSKYSIQTIKDTYSVKNTLDVWKQLQAHVASASANMQDGGGGTSTEFIVVDSILSDAVLCGYMEKFAQRTFCSENLAFIMAVQMYKTVWNHMNESASKKLESMEKARRVLGGIGGDGNGNGGGGGGGGGGDGGGGGGGSSSVVTSTSDGSATANRRDEVNVGDSGATSGREASGETGGETGGEASVETGYVTQSSGLRSTESRNSSLSQKSFTTISSNLDPSLTSTNMSLRHEYQLMSKQEMILMLTKRIQKDAAKIWFMFVSCNFPKKMSFVFVFSTI